jgi:hypothetical protein
MIIGIDIGIRGRAKAALIAVVGLMRNGGVR